MDALMEMKDFSQKITEYDALIDNYSNEPIHTDTLIREIRNSRAEIQRSYSRLEDTILKYGGRMYITDPLSGNRYDVFDIAFRPVDYLNFNETIQALDKVTAIVNKAIGKLEAEGASWDRPTKNMEGKSQENLKQEPVKGREETRTEHPMEQETLLSATSGKTNWKAIESEFGTTKMGFGKRINFIRDPFKRKIIFRDVEQAFVLASLGFSKPAVILAGSVIEELLRLYLEYKKINPIKDNFDGYIKTCEQNKLLEVGISRLSDSTRHFRNLVHLSKEKNDKYTTSKSKAKGAVASIFTIADDF